MACSCVVKLGVGVMVCDLVISNIDTNPSEASKVLPLGRIGLYELLRVQMGVIVVLDDILPPADSES